MENKIFSVSEVNTYLKSIILQDINLQNLAIQGEVSNLRGITKSKFSNLEYAYFSLKDNNSVISAISFAKSVIEAIKNKTFTNGSTVLCIGSVDLYVEGGRYNFKVTGLKNTGVGDLYLEFEKLKKYYFDHHIATREKAIIPKFCEKIAVISGDNSAAYNDIIKTIQRRFSPARIFFYPSKVQGKDAIQDLCEKITEVNKNVFDVLIIARGGGSIEDLWCFNDKKVCDLIANSKIPVITGIGHEVDITIADFVSDMTCSTPTAAAEYATRVTKEELNQLLLQTQNILKNFWDNYFLEKKHFLLQIYQMIFNEIKILVQVKKYFFDNQKNKLKINLNNLSNQQKLFFLNISLRLARLNQLFFEKNEHFLKDSKNKLINLKNHYFLKKFNFLKEIESKFYELYKNLENRGFIVIIKKNQEILRSSKDIKINEELSLNFFKEKVNVRTKVIKIEK
ncbi:exodeoxyribonuclease VII large subunit [symbiont of Argiope bruennichi]|uniref:exodeoxyribonuclease VII large subunit n=1 Tax=symbiont of Argiope bruennichi TaxID=2810479 RepID=UPI003DA2934E